MDQRNRGYGVQISQLVMGPSTDADFICNAQSLSQLSIASSVWLNVIHVRPIIWIPSAKRGKNIQPYGNPPFPAHVTLKCPSVPSPPRSDGHHEGAQTTRKPVSVESQSLVDSHHLTTLHRYAQTYAKVRARSTRPARAYSLHQSCRSYRSLSLSSSSSPSLLS